MMRAADAVLLLAMSHKGDSGSFHDTQIAPSKEGVPQRRQNTRQLFTGSSSLADRSKSQQVE